MANYYEYARTNYFLVKDQNAFINATYDMNNKGADLEVITQEAPDGVVRHGLLANMESGFPTELEYEEDGVWVDAVLDWQQFFIDHLADDEVAVIMGVGFEKLRYLTGWATAYNNKGEMREINIYDIYASARELGSQVTYAEY